MFSQLMKKMEKNKQRPNESEKWLETGRSELEEEVEKQTYVSFSLGSPGCYYYSFSISITNLLK